MTGYTQDDIDAQAEDTLETIQQRDGDDVDIEQVRDDIEELLAYSIPMEEATQQVVSTYTPSDGSSSNEDVLVADIDEDEMWANVEVQVIALFDVDHDSIAQKGRIGDESGTTLFTSFEASSDAPELEEGESYRLENVISNEYHGEFEVKLNSRSHAEQLDEAVEWEQDTMEVEGAIVDLRSGSGLIKRCTADENCSRVLNNGRCAEHGECEGEFDLRIKTRINDGGEDHDIVLDQEMTEEVSQFTLEEAKDLAMDALDTSVVAAGIENELVGEYARVEGVSFGDNLLVNEFESLEGEEPSEALEDALIQARSQA